MSKYEYSLENLVGSTLQVNIDKIVALQANSVKKGIFFHGLFPSLGNFVETSKKGFSASKCICRKLENSLQ